MRVPPLVTGEPQVLSPLEVPDWDRQTDAFRSAGVFHQTAWVRTLSETYGIRPAFLAWFDAGRLVAVLPMMECRGLLGGRTGVSLPFTDSCSPLHLENGPTGPYWAVDAALAAARRSGWQFVELRSGDARLRSRASTSFLGHELDLSPGRQSLFERCAPSVRRAVRRAGTEGLKLDFAHGAAAVEDYYHLHCLTRKRHGLPPQPWRFFLSLARNLVDGRTGFVARARLGSRIVAAAVFLTNGRRAIYKYGASLQEFQHLRANNLVMWESIVRLTETGHLSLDLGRTSFGNEGLRRFKRGWGATETEIFCCRLRAADGAVLPMQDRSSGWHTSLFRRMPVSLLKLLGSALYRFQT
ncbi:MAG TPA: hypothetical protein DCY13_20050 [Verrucomicrobiales bacterium]|nr:hypothetical protein [Verrucomicrobiales bacterium]